MNPDVRTTARTRQRYQRLAPVYDRMEVLSERSFRRWRPRLWEFVRGPKVPEVGVGTGKNMPFYPRQAEITAIDLTPGMLDRARQRAEQLRIEVDLKLGDVQQLTFSDHCFDGAVATFVFCSVPDPMLGLQELARVVKPGGHIVLLEHMRTAQPLLGLLMDLANPLVVCVMGANINRRTLVNVQRSSLEVKQVEALGMGDIVKLIVASSRGNGDQRLVP